MRAPLAYEDAMKLRLHRYWVVTMALSALVGVPASGHAQALPRVGVLVADSLEVQVGELGSVWTREASGVSSFELFSNPPDDRIGVLEGGTFYVKQGGPSA